MSENTNTLFWVITGAVIVIALFTLVNTSSNTTSNKIFDNVESKYTEIKDKALKEALEKDLVMMGSKFYSDFYYPMLIDGKTASEIVSLLSQWSYSPYGIKVNLDNLGRHKPEFAAVAAKFIHNEVPCDDKNTKAIIYPKSPYGPTDFTIDFILDCGFE